MICYFRFNSINVKIYPFVTRGLFFPCIIVRRLCLNGKDILMDDKTIIDLYWKRSETAISETANKYGRYCRRIAYNILHNNEDCEECVNDAYLKAWNAMPPKRPNRLSVFLGKIVRNLSFDRYNGYTAKKRGGGEIPLVLEELEACIPASSDTEQALDELALGEMLNCFLAGVKPEARILFVRRYWYLDPVKEIASSSGISESKVKTTLMRTRNQLKQFLEKEGVRI